MTLPSALRGPRSFAGQTQGDMVEAVLTLPLMMLLALALVNFAVVGQARSAAQNAAHFGARMGSVAIRDAEQEARRGAERALQHCLCRARVQLVRAQDAPGGEVEVRVEWEVDNHFHALLALFDGSATDTFQGTATASYRREGW